MHTKYSTLRGVLRGKRYSAMHAHEPAALGVATVASAAHACWGLPLARDLESFQFPAPGQATNLQARRGPQHRSARFAFRLFAADASSMTLNDVLGCSTSILTGGTAVSRPR